jgi:hypothetical protein
LKFVFIMGAILLIGCEPNIDGVFGAKLVRRVRVRVGQVDVDAGGGGLPTPPASLPDGAECISSEECVSGLCANFKEEIDPQTPSLCWGTATSCGSAPMATWCGDFGMPYVCGVHAGMSGSAAKLTCTLADQSVLDDMPASLDAWCCASD